MSEIGKSTDKKKRSSHVRTSSRGRGHRLTKEETAQKQRSFLQSFRSNGNVRAACMVANVDRGTIYQWAEHDEQFSMEYNQAKEDVNDAIRAEIFRRGMFGDEEYVINNGRIAKDDTGKPLTKRVKSDLLLMFHAKSRMPEYREKQQVEMSGSIDVSGSQQSLLAKLAQAAQEDKAE